MELREALHTRDIVVRFRTGALPPDRVQNLLATVTSTPSFAQQAPFRLLVVEDEPTKAALRRACEALRARWFEEPAAWALAALERGGEPRELALLDAAPAVVCVFGEIDKPHWREAAWSAAERLGLAALAEGWRAVPVRVETFGFLNALLGVPQAFAGAGILALGEPEELAPAGVEAPRLQDLQLPHQPCPERLEHWTDPVRLARLDAGRELRERPFVSDKQLVLDIVDMASGLLASQDPDAIFARVGRELQHLFRHDHASVAAVDDEDGRLRLRLLPAGVEPLPNGRGEEIPLADSNVFGWVMLNRSGLARGDIAADELFAPLACEAGLQSDMIVPLLTGGRALGTLAVGSRRAHAFTQSDFDILREIGKLVAAAVEKSTLFHSAQSLAACDALTGLYNHRHFHTRLAQEVERSRRYRLSCGLLLLDVDRFRLLNGSFGHEVGDRVLVSLAQALRDSVRAADLVARYAGEEFAIIVPETHSEALQVMAERIRSTVESRVHALYRDDVAVKTTVSIGGCVLPAAEVEPDTLIARADTALYRAKCLGGNRVCLHGPVASAARHPAAGA